MEEVRRVASLGLVLDGEVDIYSELIKESIERLEKKSSSFLSLLEWIVRKK